MTERLEARLKEQGYTISDCCEFEYYDDADVAADREKELNLKFGYPWNDRNDFRVIRKITNDRMGKPLSDITKSKISKANSGNRHTDAVRKMIADAQRGSKHHMTSFTDEDIINIRKYFSMGTKQSQLARMFGVSRQVIYGIVRRKYWNHI